MEKSFPVISNPKNTQPPFKAMDISAIIPVYNGKQYIKEAIDSIIGQSKQPIELIIVDDGSIDGSIEEIQKIQAPFPIHIFKQSNAGQSSARNKGIRSAKGDFIALLDQDDIWHNDHLEKLSRVFLEENSDRLGWVYSNVDQIDEQGKVFRSGLLNFCDFKHPQTQLEEMIKTDMHILPSASLIRKNALLDVALFDERLQGYEDDDLFLRLYAAGWKSRYLPQPLLKWRIHSGNSGSITGFKSRRIYAQKIIDDFSDTIGRNTAAEIVGARFFAVTLMFYKQALDLNDFQRCKWLHEDLKKYFKLSRQSLKKWKYRIPFMKYPQLIKLMLKIKQQLLHR